MSYRSKILIIGAAALFLTIGISSFYNRSSSEPAVAAAQPLQVEVNNSKGEKIGEAVLTSVSGGVKITVNASKLTPGLHGIHIHETGICEGPDFLSAGGHFNPVGKHHGALNKNGPHSGDLPNLFIDQKGNGFMELITDSVSLQRGVSNSLLKAGGTSLIIHENNDDLTTDPSGNSGKRIACGVIK